MSYIAINRLVVTLLVASIVLLGFLSILSIWEVIESEDVLWKSLTTSLVLIIVGTVTLASLKFLEEREKNAPRT